MKGTMFIASRRDFLKYALSGAALLGAGRVVPGLSSALAAENKGENVLILYFSRSGNTRKIAQQIHLVTGGDILELEPANPYPPDYDSVVEVAKQEQRDNARPQIKTEIPDLARYHTVFIGFPNWWGTMPMLFFTLLEKYNFAGKNIALFCTHGGSRLGRSEDDVKRLRPGAKLFEGLEVRGNQVDGAKDDVNAWLKKLGFAG